MKRVGRDEAISRTEFHARLRDWYTTTEDNKIGDADFNQTAWIHIEHEGSLYHLNSDTQRRGVEEYVNLLDQWGDEIRWSTVPNRNGRENAVAYGPDEMRIRRFYLYILRN